MSIAEKYATLNNVKIPEVYEAGKKAEYDAFWDNCQDYGKRNDYQYSFANNGWNDENFKPKYDMVLKAGYGGTSMFNMCQVTNIAEALEKQGVTLDTSKCGYMTSMFASSKTIRIPELNLTSAHTFANGAGYLFNASKVETIDKLIVTELLEYPNAFNSCSNLKNIVFDGVIGKSINFQWSPLSVASMKSIISCLKNLKGTSEEFTQSVKFNDDCWAALEADGTSPTGTNWEEYVDSLGWLT